MNNKIKQLPHPHKGFLYENVLAMQSINILEAYPKLFDSENFDLCIELGTAFGGLSLFIRDYLGFKGEFVTYDYRDNLVDYEGYLGTQKWPNEINDLVPPNIHEKFKEYNIDYRNKDVFSTDTINEITQLIKTNKKVILICDGGDKKREINLFSEHLKNGDVILGHDYFRDGKVINDIWPVCELDLSMIKPSLDKHNVVFDNNYTELFDNSVTFIGIKNE